MDGGIGKRKQSGRWELGKESSPGVGEWRRARQGRPFRERISLLALTAGRGRVVPTRQKGCYGHKSRRPSVGPTGGRPDQQIMMPARSTRVARPGGLGPGKPGGGRRRVVSPPPSNYSTITEQA